MVFVTPVAVRKGPVINAVSSNNCGFHFLDFDKRITWKKRGKRQMRGGFYGSGRLIFYFKYHVGVRRIEVFPTFEVCLHADF